MKYLCRECNSIWEDNQVDGKCHDCGSFELIVIEKDYKKTVEKLRGMLREAKEIEDQELIKILSKKINKLGQLKVKRDLKNKTTMQILEKINHDMAYHVPEETFPVYQIRLDEIKNRLENYVEIERKYKDLRETAESCSSAIERNKEKLTSGEIENSDFLAGVYQTSEKLQMKLAELENLI
jgi:DNA-directed RNA polymerase subunit RPC12/RpoP